MLKVLLVFSDLELPMIVHSASSRAYFAQFVHSGRKMRDSSSNESSKSFAIRKNWWT